MRSIIYYVKYYDSTDIINYYQKSFINLFFKSINSKQN